MLWQRLDPPLRISAPVLAEMLDGGQSFTWHPQADGIWQGVWGLHLVHLRLDEASNLTWSSPTAQAADLATYFAADIDWARLDDDLPWRSDPVLARARQRWPGLRILRQPFGETLLGFLCSATKQIVQIKDMLRLLAERYGAPLGEGRFTLPTWERLAEIPEAELRACKLGFRGRYVAQVAAFLREHPGWLVATEALPYPTAHARLMTLPGVGAKVADCVLLFGAGRVEAFPVDTWVLQALSRCYGLEGWKPSALAQFGRLHFGAAAGLAQQYLFADIRRAGRR